jgi:hypothetical protein
MRAPACAADAPASLAAAAALAVGAPEFAWGWPGFFFAGQAARAPASTSITKTFRVDMC